MNRTLDKLKDDKDYVQKLLEESKAQIDDKTSNLLSVILMVKQDLTALVNDEVEEKQKII